MILIGTKTLQNRPALFLRDWGKIAIENKLHFSLPSLSIYFKLIKTSLVSTGDYFFIATYTKKR